jgi:hypothetical protein
VKPPVGRIGANRSGPRRCADLGRGPRTRRAEHGQAAVELAFALVVVVVLLLVLVQAGLVIRDQVLVVHAARDAARLASTGADHGDVAERVRRALPGAEVDIAGSGGVGTPVRVEVRYRSHTDLPLVGSWLPDFELRESAAMRAER